MKLKASKVVAAAIRDAFDRCAVAHDTTASGFVSYLWVGPHQAEQRHHGTTDYSLAAWHAWSMSGRRYIRRARGVTDYLVPNLGGVRAIKTPALVLEDLDGTALVLTGCAWGYGGEGPHGTLLVLVDAGFFDDVEAARVFVAGLDGCAPWELDHPGAQ